MGPIWTFLVTRGRLLFAVGLTAAAVMVLVLPVASTVRTADTPEIETEVARPATPTTSAPGVQEVHEEESKPSADSGRTDPSNGGPAEAVPPTRTTTQQPAPASTPHTTPGPAFADYFTGPDGLLINEYARYNPEKACARSSTWILTSGSMFRKNNEAYSGVPDRGTTDCHSRETNNSNVFRAVTRRDDFNNYHLSFDYKNHTRNTAQHSYDGLHAYIRYQSEQALYAVSFGRWDGRIVIKKKVPGGPSNGGTYYD